MLYPLHDHTSFKCSEIITKSYSTSFSLGIRMIHKSIRAAIYNIYGFVRLADEIVDTFHEHDKEALIDRFENETFEAIEIGLSTNPVLHAFQYTVNQYGITHDLIRAFLKSMKMDLHKTTYEDDGYKEYIYGSAEVVGLMCLHVFCHDQPGLYEKLVPNARSLGSAFQKINFLRDMQSDVEDRGRVYFPNVNFQHFSDEDKKAIEADILKDFDHAYLGIVQLPRHARFGVYLAYVYYTKLFKKIAQCTPHAVKRSRIRIADSRKAMLLLSSVVRHNLNML